MRLTHHRVARAAWRLNIRGADRFYPSDDSCEAMETVLERVVDATDAPS